VLQDGRATPVGATEGRRVDCRIVAATNRDLRREVAAGRIREDLYQRLAAHVIEVPSLATHRMDVPELFVHFLARQAEAHAELAWLFSGGQRWRPTIPEAFFVRMLKRPWPGNVRELQNLVEQTARLNLRSETFQSPEPEDRAPETPPQSTSPPPPEPPAAASDAAILEMATALGLAPKTLGKLLDAKSLERARLLLSTETAAARTERLQALAADALFARLLEHDFNQSRVAEALGASRTTLVKMMRDLGLRRAGDLTLPDIEAALTATGHLDGAAQALKVSPQALKKQLTLLRLRAGA
jgi:DNA-binding NtrC family response regulator